jgi:hypothetical protein
LRSACLSEVAGCDRRAMGPTNQPTNLPGRMEGEKPTTSVPMRSRCDITQRGRMGMGKPPVDQRGGNQPADILACVCGSSELGRISSCTTYLTPNPPPSLFTASRLLPLRTRGNLQTLEPVAATPKLAKQTTNAPCFV